MAGLDKPSSHNTEAVAARPSDRQTLTESVEVRTAAVALAGSRGVTFILAALPALLVLLFATSAGGFDAPLRPWSTLVGHLALAGFALVGARAGLDPLGLDRPRSWFVGLLAVSVAISAIRSPVSAAAIEPCLLAVLGLYAARGVASAWCRDAARSSAPLAIAGVLLGVALLSLVGVLKHGFPAAAPLGHHNLLGAWLVAMLPFAILAMLGGSIGRLVGGLAAAAGLAAVLATGSLGATLGLSAAVATILVGRLKGKRRIALGTVLVALACLAAPRLDRIRRGEDSSSRVRLGYAEAAVGGIGERPFFGWGPGAAPWTFAWHVRPRPGINPAGEVVADPHSLPLRLTYDLGLVGVLLLTLTVVAAFWRRRRAAGLDSAVGASAAALAAASLVGRPLAAAALPVVAVVVLGAHLATGSRAAGRSRASSWTAGPFVASSLVALSVALLVCLDAARIADGQASAATDEITRRTALRRAVRLDPFQPLYRARLAAFEGDAAGLASAALVASGVGPLYLAAGGQAADPVLLLLRACRLDPLGAMAPALLARAAPKDPRAAGWAARALAAQPRMLAATMWIAQPRLRARAIDKVLSEAGIDRGWRRDFMTLAQSLEIRPEPVASLAVWADREAATSVSLHVFARQPRPWRLAALEVDADAAAAVDLPSAAALVTTSVTVFSGGDCMLGSSAEARRPDL